MTLITSLSFMNFLSSYRCLLIIIKSKLFRNKKVKYIFRKKLRLGILFLYVLEKITKSQGTLSDIHWRSRSKLGIPKRKRRKRCWLRSHKLS